MLTSSFDSFIVVLQFKGSFASRAIFMPMQSARMLTADRSSWRSVGYKLSLPVSTSVRCAVFDEWTQIGVRGGATRTSPRGASGCHAPGAT